jgi:hypothetical protein
VETIENNTRHKMQDAAYEVLQHKATVPQRLLYGHWSDQRPFMMSYMDIKPNPNVTMKIPNINSYTPGMNDMITSALSANFPVANNFDGEKEFVCEQAFEKTVFLKHISNCGVTEEELAQVNIFHEPQLRESLIAAQKEAAQAWVQELDEEKQKPEHKDRPEAEVIAQMRPRLIMPRSYPECLTLEPIDLESAAEPIRKRVRRHEHKQKKNGEGKDDNRSSGVRRRRRKGSKSRSKKTKQKSKKQKKSHHKHKRRKGDYDEIDEGVHDGQLASSSGSSSDDDSSSSSGDDEDGEEKSNGSGSNSRRQRKHKRTKVRHGRPPAEMMAQDAGGFDGAPNVTELG